MADRRSFLKQTLGVVAAVGTAGLTRTASAFPMNTGPFKISLAEWSLHRTIRAGEMDPLDFARVAREKYGVGGIEYVNQFFADKARDAEYIGEMKRRANDNGVQSVLIMVDNEGRLGDPDKARRLQAVANHYQWADAAKTLGCHSIRVNAASEGTYEEQQKLAADGLRRLAEYVDAVGINVIVENHGGLSSNGQWLTGVMQRVDHPRCGTLPDFGNFRISDEVQYDRYQGVAEMMPYAKAVSAKSHDFDKAGYEVHTDFSRMMDIVLAAGYHGFVGIEYEGDSMSEHEGILATRDLLRRIEAEKA